jgi:uncharacterized phage infection (PIP) family protein YhgE
MTSTAQEALIAELLGDVGKLHDAIKALPDKLNESVTPTLEAIANATKDANAAINQQADEIDQRIAEHAALVVAQALLPSFENVEAGAERVQKLTAQIQQQLTRSEAAVEQLKKRGGVVVSGVTRWVLALAVLSAVGSGVAAWFTYAQYRDTQYAKVGAAVAAAWPRLDPAAQKTIQREFHGRIAP